jgi:hypothetical protein
MNEHKGRSPGTDAGFRAVLADDIAVDGSWIKRAIKPVGTAVVFHRPEDRPFLACAGVLPSLPLETGRFTPSTGLPSTALWSHR